MLSEGSQVLIPKPQAPSLPSRSFFMLSPTHPQNPSPSPPTCSASHSTPSPHRHAQKSPSTSPHQPEPLILPKSPVLHSPILTPNLCNLPTLHPHPYPLLHSPTLKLPPHLSIPCLVSSPVPHVLKHTLPHPPALPASSGTLPASPTASPSSPTLIKPLDNQNTC